jgi:hypothetical protein
LLYVEKGGGAMSKFLRLIALSNRKHAFTAMTLALLLLIGAADLIVRNNGMQASGIEQARVYRVREGLALDKVIRIEDIYNINSPEFPKGLQVKIKNLSSKPIYYILINVHLKGTEQFRLQGDIWFELEFGHPKLVQNSLRLEDLTQADREEHPLTSIEPDKTILLGFDEKEAEYVRRQIETEFGAANPVTKNLDLTVQVINFGDGTGYIIGHRYPNRM